VQWRVGLVFGAAGMAGAYLGGLLARFIPGSVLLIGFALMMVATAAAMLRGRRTAVVADQPGHRLPVFKIVLEGLVVGLVTGLVGAGGGFLVVPALVLLGGLPMPVAVGTSLVVIAMKSFAGLAGHLAAVDIDWGIAGLVLGGLVGARLTALINPDVLRKAFGWFVLAMSSVIFAQEIHPAAGIATAVLTVIAGVVYAVRGRAAAANLAESCVPAP
jgi:uncharacterized membrane protein YfcA